VRGRVPRHGPTLVDPTLAADGKHLVVLTTLVDYDSARRGASRSRAPPTRCSRARSANSRPRVVALLCRGGLAANDWSATRSTPPERSTAGSYRRARSASRGRPSARRLPGSISPGTGRGRAGGIYGVTVSGVQCAQLVLATRRPTSSSRASLRRRCERQHAPRRVTQWPCKPETPHRRRQPAARSAPRARLAPFRRNSEPNGSSKPGVDRPAKTHT